MENHIKRNKAWRDGHAAGAAGLSEEACNQPRGTIYFDDWHDGYEAAKNARNRP